MQNGRIKITCDCETRLPISQLENFQGELKSTTAEDMAKLKKSIVKYGFSFPIFAWDKKILDGHQRLAATKSLIAEGYEVEGDALPVVLIKAKDATEAAEKLLLINSRYAQIEQDGFDIDLEDISSLIDIPDIDFNLEPDDYSGNTDPDDVPEVEEVPVSKTGDLWILGDHRLLCGDSTKIDDVERLMGGEKADMVFTDPPYSLTGGGCKGDFIKGGFLDPKNFIDKSNSNLFEVPDFEDWIKIFPQIMKESSELFLMSNNRNLYEMMTVLTEYKAKIHNILILYKNTGTPHLWYKPNHEFILYYYFGAAIKPLHKNQSSVFQIKMDSFGDKNHPSQKPIELISKILNNHPHKLIYEPFSGSGSTIIAAQQTNRRAYAMEISPQYIDVSVKRWQDFTGKEAILESTGQSFGEVKSERQEVVTT